MKPKRVEFRILDGNLDDMIRTLIDLQNIADDLACYISECFENETDADEGTVAARFAELEVRLDKAEEHYNNFIKEKEND